MLDGMGWPEPRWSDSTGSTNQDALAALPLPEGTVIGADEQRQGRGRLDREWRSDPGAGLWFSIVIDPTAGPMALAVGVGIRQGLSPWVHSDLKWPNDVLVHGRKLCGILIEVAEQVVVGVGLNLHTPSIPEAVGLADVTDSPWHREQVLAAVVRGVRDAIAQLRTDPAALLMRYREACVTLGRQVDVTLPGGRTLTGNAADIDTGGHLIVKSQDITQTVFAGDVVHATI
jgi:BirA family transcriptional regulator, biotin operon repressor / biotin---[acetyl-CoA-carboxylase] ligase